MTEVRCTRCDDRNGPWGRVDGELVTERCLDPQPCPVCKGHREVLVRTLEPDAEWYAIPCVCTGEGLLCKPKAGVA